MPRHNGHILSLSNLDVSYGDVRAVRGLSLAVSHGEIIGLVGESGSGKSSVLRAIAGLLGHGGRISAGSIMFDLARLDQGSSGWREGIAYVFQEPRLSLDPLFRVGSQFDECLRAHGMTGREEMRATERALLEEMGFSDVDRVLGAYPHNLSGGMCQRVVLAMAVACRPQLLLADEPTSALDVVSQRQVLDLLLRVREEHGVTMVIVSHNIAAVARVADRLGVMYRGRLVELGERERVLQAPEHPYTQNLIAAIPRGDGQLPALPRPWEGA